MSNGNPSLHSLEVFQQSHGLFDVYTWHAQVTLVERSSLASHPSDFLCSRWHEHVYIGIVFCGQYSPWFDLVVLTMTALPAYSSAPPPYVIGVYKVCISRLEHFFILVIPFIRIYLWRSKTGLRSNLVSLRFGNIHIKWVSAGIETVTRLKTHRNFRMRIPLHYGKTH